MLYFSSGRELRTFTSLQAEIEAKKGMKVDDPFTRRSTRPTMVTRTKEPDIQSSEMLIRMEMERKKKQEDEKRKKVSVDLGLTRHQGVSFIDLWLSDWGEQR